MSTFLPEVAPQDLIIWDRERSQCCGYLLKQASKSSAFNRGKWQKRWVFININLEDDENYCLEYSHGPEDKTASQSFSLVNCNIKISVENTFMLTYMDEVLLTLKAEDADEMKEWIRTIENVTVVANAREKILDADDEEDDDEEVGRGKGNRKELRQMILNKKNSGAGAKVKDTEKAKEKKFFKKKKADDENEEEEESEEESEEGSVRIVRTGFSRTPLRLFPTLRIDVDIDSIPPASTDRHLLLESFVNDIANALSITPAWVDVVSVKAAPGMNWLTQIEFDINVPLPQMDEAEKNDEEYVDALQSERFEIRSKLLLSLRELVSDEASPIYNGLITCKLDPSFCEHFADDASSETGEIKPFSADAKVLALMNKYKDIEVPEGTLDVSHFTILLYFEKRMAAVHVPNPMVVAKRSCNLWPFEVKQALGFTGTMQELWLDPIALIPRDMPKSLSQPIYFEPSVRYNGALLINATKLKADLAYNVLFEGLCFLCLLCSYFLIFDAPLA